AQPRAIGLKVSDEFTVPLCRGHHRQLHQAGDERAWWEGQRVNALEFGSARTTTVMKRDDRKHVGKPTLAELQTKLDGVRREVRNLTVMGMDPKQPPDQAALIKDLEQSARVEMRLRSMALKYAKGEPCSHRQQRDKNAARD
ncbi:MAG: hypothetical protein WCD64_13835, partial [Pseudolabrys sp.]